MLRVSRPLRWYVHLGLVSAAMLGTMVGLSGTSAAGEVPMSQRLRQALSRVRPVLEKAVRAKGLTYGAPIFIRIFKASNQLELWLQKEKRFNLFRTYNICAFSGGLGPKLQTGDFKSPEGFYRVSPQQMNPRSSYHLSFNLGYPNAYDRAHKRTGSALMVHGDCISAGCYAMTDAKIEEIYALADAALRHGQPFFYVHVFPFRMTSERLRTHSDSPWFDFWSNLREGYEYFEHYKRPPSIRIKNKRYTFY